MWNSLFLTVTGEETILIFRREYTAIMFMPLVLYGMWRVYMLPEESKEHGRSWIPLTIGCAELLFNAFDPRQMKAQVMCAVKEIVYH